jgi:apolipoprotein N-acyltransferase
MKWKIYSVGSGWKLERGGAAGLLVAAIVSAVLASPKFGISFFAWVYPICLLIFFRRAAVRRKAVWALPALMLAHFLADLGVAPFPVPVLLGLCIYQSLLQLALYGADAWVSRRTDSFLSTLFFPSFAVGLEFLNTVYGGGIWWSVANSQAGLSWLTQLASVTGIWGIGFFLYWTASVLVWMLKRRAWGKRRLGLGIYGVMLAVVVFAGYYRYAGVGDDRQTVRVAGVTVPLVKLYETFYSDYCGRRIVVNPRASVTDPVMRLVGQAETGYIESGDPVRYRNASEVIGAVNDSLFALSQQAVDRGARIVCWSEGNGIGWAADEARLIGRGRQFAAANQVYLLMTLCLVHPGKITPGKKFLENEAVLLGPNGELLTTFHKNNPVPMVEASQPGDGVIPVIQTPYGRLAVSICYDADQPEQMRQLGRKDADLLLLPSGDWYAISRFHTQVAVYRGIENGCSIFREVSNGLSEATDYRGKVIGSRDWFREGRTLWLADMPVGHVNTIYGRIGDTFPYGCLLCALAMVLSLVVIRNRTPADLLGTDRRVLQP